MKISPLAVIDPKAEIGADCEIGPFCVIGPDVVLGPGCCLKNNVTLAGHTTIGRENVFFSNCVVGEVPQDRKYRGGPTKLVIGDNNVIREAVTIHTGTEQGGGVTSVGNSNLLMVNAHLGHDAHVGSHCTIANNAMIAGHVKVGDYASVAAAVGVHHFVTIGEYCFIGAYARIHHDVPPYLKIDGSDEVRGLNKVGLLRAGLEPDDIEALDEACRRLFYRERPFAAVLAEFDTLNGLNRHVKRLVEFLRQRDQGIHGRYQESLRVK